MNGETHVIITQIKQVANRNSTFKNEHENPMESANRLFICETF